MTDIVDKATRSRMMSGVRGRNTKLELVIRKALHARGFRYRVHVAGLAGKPDIVLPRFSAVILVHGCFWHGHDCPLFRLPGTHTDFWHAKISRNRERDGEVLDALVGDGWRCLTVWECALRGPGRRELSSVLDQVVAWLGESVGASEIKGRALGEPVVGQVATVVGAGGTFVD